ncbi:sensor domain-containing phosphodiesterase [Alkalibacillus haloalkaliphilus]|uniref:sensor domain-containing phosphodiesterase n=1 Tax=Alkalibacillus haloalkaliphilus TaxID=94136 RepID=UPI0029356213|nr:EAL domain-containing protein [Alkalibacillus haloalkaliphilus]MDV2581354.1 EAL domain-containing protein [Alkalibacillus haloalkaliphilus]
MSGYDRDQNQLILTPEEFVEGYQYITEYISDGVPLRDVLIKAIKFFELRFEASKGTIMLLDEMGTHFSGGVTHSLPEEMMNHFTGIELYEGMGTCGTAACRKELVVTTDISQDEKWDPFRNAVEELGLKSCWSVPIFAPESNNVAGVFAMYSTEVREPTQAELETIESFKELISLIVTNYIEVNQRHVNLQDSYKDPDKVNWPSTLSDREKYMFMIRRGIEEGQIRPNYQPLMSACDEVYGFEVLVRWPHPEQGTIPPNKFIPFAEEEGFVDEIDRYVCEYACREMKQLMDALGQKFILSVNVSAKHIVKGHYVEELKATLERTGFPAELLAVEITESSLVINLKEAAQVIERLRELGIQVWVDDFGTVYSSLNYLRNLPLDLIKLDGSFVKNIHESHVDRTICETIINLAHDLDLQVVSEGIEYEEQFNTLKAMGCEYFQGYHFQKPMSLDEVKEYLATVKVLDQESLA